MTGEGHENMTRTGRTDQHKGQEYRCDDCGGLFWTAWANARRHTCDPADSADASEDDDSEPEVRMDGGENIVRCYLCRKQFTLASSEDHGAVLNHYVNDHPDSDALASVLDGVEVWTECSICHEPFQSAVAADPNRGVFKVKSNCSSCVRADPLRSVVVEPVTGQTVMDTEARPDVETDGGHPIMTDGGENVGHVVRVHHSNIGREGAIVELRPADMDTAAERDMTHLSHSEASALHEQLGEYLDAYDADGDSEPAVRTDGGEDVEMDVWPIQGTITLLDSGNSLSIGPMIEHLTEHDSGNLVKQAEEMIHESGYEPGDTVQLTWTERGEVLSSGKVETERDTYRPDTALNSDITTPVHMDRADDTLKARHYTGSGISEPEGELIAVSYEPDDTRAGFAGYRSLKIYPDELDDYITILTALRDAMAEQDGESDE